MQRFVLIVVFFCKCIYAQSVYDAVLTNMVTALNQPGGTLKSDFTNQLNVCINVVTNKSHSANLKLVQAISLADMAEEHLGGGVLLGQALSICSNISMSAELPCIAWQRGAAAIIQSGVFAFEGNRVAACHTITNEIVQAAHNIQNVSDFYLWRAIAKHLFVDGLTVQEALRCYAAIALLNNDSAADVSFYTNGLPRSICSRIQEFAK
jgi:hypothetical protein